VNATVKVAFVPSEMLVLLMPQNHHLHVQVQMYECLSYYSSMNKCYSCNSYTPTKQQLFTATVPFAGFIEIVGADE
jgi:hypothetical protein